jgi:radical SAM-linked protein
MDQRLPWHRVFAGLHPKFLKNEYNKALFGLATEDCSFSSCHECGLCNNKNGLEPLHASMEVTSRSPEKKDLSKEPSALPEPTKFRIQYAKWGAGVYLSTLELQKVFSKSFSRAGVPMGFSQGMHPRPLISMGPALSLGIASNCELFDITLLTDLTADNILDAINPLLPTHIQFKTVTLMDQSTPPISRLIQTMSYRYKIPPDQRRLVDKNVSKIQTTPRFVIERTRKSRQGEIRKSRIDIKESLAALQLSDEHLNFTVRASGGQGINPYLILQASLGEACQPGTLLPLEKTGWDSRL